jgi:hypothetical protein
MDVTVKELALLSLTACFAAGWALSYGANYFALFFAATAAFAGVEAARRSL